MSESISSLSRSNYVRSIENQQDIEVSTPKIQTLLEDANRTHEIFKKNLSSVIQHLDAIDQRFSQIASQGQSALQTAIVSSSPIHKSRMMQSSSSSTNSEITPKDMTTSEIILLAEHLSSQELGLADFSDDSEVEILQQDDSEVAILKQEEEISFEELGKDLSESAKKLRESMDELLIAFTCAEKNFKTLS